jgi:hypothetical protein
MHPIDADEKDVSKAMSLVIQKTTVLGFSVGIESYR